MPAKEQCKNEGHDADTRDGLAGMWLCTDASELQYTSVMINNLETHCPRISCRKVPCAGDCGCLQILRGGCVRCVWMFRVFGQCGVSMCVASEVAYSDEKMVG